ncbi:cytochrome P450 [Coccomyxa subellipsoidea C-169]|uniref:Cytochrome P450 n=1 Tax=Coccomyxa subellipsoidea (strain C-169) TaxID=574566 RepID=I0YKZ1_COCSC|nr:cytochrome P450 [Coccomyxa subellipsoidea C-169]EIE19060.1 cytochrome P450 [Coccomyxa subellipsoidea C-169]|eukprot:XP_005643604.1 cytochrome P450 [Coccomyxa subellipsoidea C-169]
MPNLRSIPLFGRHVRLGDVAQQLAWHQYDFIFFTIVSLTAFIWAITVLARAASGTLQGGSFLVAICSAYIALAGWTVLRLATAMHKRSVALRHLPGPKYPFLLGFMELVERKDVHRYATELAEQFGPIFKFRIMCFHVVCITDPVLATQVLRSKVVDKLRFQYSFLDPFLGGTNMLTGHTDDHWKAVRKAVAPAFSAGNMRFALAHVIEASMSLVKYLKESGYQKVHNVDNLLLRESMDVIGRFGFQREMNALSSLHSGRSEDSDNVNALLGSTHEIEKRLPEVNRWLKLWKKDVREGWAVLGRFKTIIWQLLDHIKAGQPKPGSFADLLLKAKDPKTGKRLSDEKMFPEMAALFFAGIDTTGHTGTFVLYLISQHPEVEAGIMEELDSLELTITPERPNPRPMVYGDLSKMVYLNAVIKEALRMYPPVSIGQVRVSNTHDITLGGRLHIPAGTAIWVPHHAMQNVSYNWDEPEKFKPERWLTPGTEYAVPEKLPLPREWYKEWEEGTHTGATRGLTDADINEGDSMRPKRYFPFAEGPRNCVGQNLAKVSLLGTMATLMQHFTFRLADEMGGPKGVRETEHYTLVVGLAKGMLMHAVPREAARKEE